MPQVLLAAPTACPASVRRGTWIEKQLKRKDELTAREHISEIHQVELGAPRSGRLNVEKVHEVIEAKMLTDELYIALYQSFS